MASFDDEEITSILLPDGRNFKVTSANLAITKKMLWDSHSKLNAYTCGYTIFIKSAGEKLDAIAINNLLIKNDKGLINFTNLLGKMPSNNLCYYTILNRCFVPDGRPKTYPNIYFDQYIHQETKKSILDISLVVVDEKPHFERIIGWMKEKLNGL